MPSDVCRQCLRYLHTPHRLRLVGAFKQLSPDRGPVLFQVRSQGIETHTIDTGGSLVAFHMRQRPPQIVSLDNRFHRRPTGRLAFGFGSRRPGFGPSMPPLRASPVAAACKVISSQFSAASPVRDRRSTCRSIVQAFTGSPRLLRLLLTSALRSGRLAAAPVPTEGHSTDLPR